MLATPREPGEETMPACACAQPVAGTPTLLQAAGMCPAAPMHRCTSAFCFAVTAAGMPVAAAPERAASVPIPPTPPHTPGPSPCPSCASSSSCCHTLDSLISASQLPEDQPQCMLLLQSQMTELLCRPAESLLPAGCVLQPEQVQDGPVDPPQQQTCCEQAALPGYEPASSILSASAQRQLSVLGDASSMGSIDTAVKAEAAQAPRRVRFGAVVYHYYVPEPQPCLQEILCVQAAQRQELLDAGMLTEDSEGECSQDGGDSDSDSGWDHHDGHDGHDHDLRAFCRARHGHFSSRDSDSDGHENSSDGYSFEEDEDPSGEGSEDGSEEGSIATYECRHMAALTPAVAQFVRFAPLLGLDLAGGAPIKVFRRIQALYGINGADAGGARSSCGCSCDSNAYQLLELMDAVRCMPLAAMAHALGVHRNQHDLLERFACQLLQELSS